MLLAAGREVVSKTSAYNITKLSYRVEVRMKNTNGISHLCRHLIFGNHDGRLRNVFLKYNLYREILI